MPLPPTSLINAVDFLGFLTLDMCTQSKASTQSCLLKLLRRMKVPNLATALRQEEFQKVWLPPNGGLQMGQDAAALHISTTILPLYSTTHGQRSAISKFPSVAVGYQSSTASAREPMKAAMT